MKIKPVKVCMTCPNYVLQTYHKDFLNIGRCLHIAFFKAGFGRCKFDGSMEYTHRSRRDRLPAEVVLDLQKEGWSYVDTLDMKNDIRKCQHWISGLTFAKKALDFYEEENYQIPEWLHPLVKQWFKEGCPTESRKLERFKPFLLFEYDYEEISDKYLKYYPCSMCNFFTPLLNPEGSIVPLRGTCSREKIDSGIFSSIQTDLIPTYSFYSCELFLVSQKYKMRQFYEENFISDKLHSFIEINKPDMSMREFQDRVRFPLIWHRDLLDLEKHKELLEMDLSKNLLQKHKAVDFKGFDKDMSLEEVREFFKKRLKLNSRKSKEFWENFESYNESSSIYKKN